MCILFACDSYKNIMPVNEFDDYLARSLTYITELHVPFLPKTNYVKTSQLDGYNSIKTLPLVTS